MGAIGIASATPLATPNPNRPKLPESTSVVVNLVDFFTA
jgi:hypothetical protein